MKPDLENTYQLQPATASCALYDTLDFCRMADGAMDEVELERLVQHCEECEECSSALWEFQKVTFVEQENVLPDSIMHEQNERILSRTLNLLDRLNSK
jgi:hypothetical protein